MDLPFWIATFSLLLILGMALFVMGCFYRIMFMAIYWLLTWLDEEDRGRSDGQKGDDVKDQTYSEGCGCTVTFFAESDYRTSWMLPGKECTAHTGRYQVAERDCLMERARRHFHLEEPPHDEPAKPRPCPWCPGPTELIVSEAEPGFLNVICKKCGCCGPWVRGDAAAAIAAWNQRKDVSQ